MASINQRWSGYGGIFIYIENIRLVSQMAGFKMEEILTWKGS